MAILTTNYDTLIERAASQVVIDFKLVTNKDTLLYSPSPRIIKLHGSFPNIHSYIMTQEDYRRYPIERPEMLNTAKQCFLESLGHPNLAIPVFDKEETGFNDVVVGFDKGIESANRKND